MDRLISAFSLAACLSLGACNKPPAAPTLAIEPAEPTTLDELVGRIAVQAEDPNGKDEISYSWSWTFDGEARDDLDGDTVPAGVTSKGQVWELTVVASDGREDAPAASASVTILNSAPVATVELSPELPVVTDDLVASVSADDDDGDTVSFSYSWTADGVDAGISEASVPAADTQRGELWEVTAVPNDGEADGEPATAQVTIDNTAPELLSVVLTPEPAYEASTLSAEVEGEDPDGDEIGLSYAWYVGGDLVLEGEQATLDGEHFDKHDAVHALVTPNDGFVDGEQLASETVTISNTAPSLASAAIDPTELTEASTASCVSSGWSDDDGDAEELVIAWYVNGTALSSAETIDGGSFDRGDELICELTPTDGEDDGLPVSSDPVTVGNTPPELASAALSTTSPTENDSISVTVSGASDADNDSVTLSYAWYVGGSLVATVPAISGLYFDKGDIIYAEVTPSDGSDDGTPVTSDVATAVNSPPVLSEVSISPSELYTDDLALSTVSSDDDDGDAVTLSYAWTVDGSGAGSGATLDGATAFDKGQQVELTVTPSDGSADGTALASGPVMVLNSPPSAPVVAISPSEPYAEVDDLFCEILTESSDDDGDSVSYLFSWTVNGAAFSGAYTSVWRDDSVPASATGDAETWICSATPDDGDDQGDPGTASVDIGEGGPSCEYPDETITASSGPASGPSFTPEYFAVEAIGVIEGDTVYDWDYDGSLSSAYLEFKFYDSSVSHLCSLVYDMSDATAASGWSSSSGGGIFGAFDVALADGYTDCAAVGASTWGSTDLRDVVEAWDWGVGVGEMVDVTSDLRSAVMSYGYDWTNDWEPYVYSGYLWSDLFGVAYEIMYGFSYDEECGELLLDSRGDLVYLPAPSSGPLPDAAYDISAYYVFYADSLIP